jgi:dCTP deaminase
LEPGDDILAIAWAEPVGQPIGARCRIHSTRTMSAEADALTIRPRERLWWRSMFLRDEELHKLVNGKNVIAGLPKDRVPYSAGSPIQAASVDLRIGRIHIPGTKEGETGSSTRPRTRFELGRGQTAVVMTWERCNLPADIGAIGFPPAGVSSKGILMTNPGHVDPGYKGNLSFTVINMGREAYELKKGDLIVTLMLFALATPAKEDYAARKGQGSTSVRQELLDGLSHDFLDVDRRVDKAVRRSERMGRNLAIAVPLLTAIIAFGAAYLATRADTGRLDDQVKMLQTQVENARQRELSLRETVGRLDGESK